MQKEKKDVDDDGGRSSDDNGGDDVVVVGDNGGGDDDDDDDAHKDSRDNRYNEIYNDKDCGNDNVVLKMIARIGVVIMVVGIAVVMVLWFMVSIIVGSSSTQVMITLLHMT